MSSFFEDLPAFADFTGAADLSRYSEAPADWLVVVTDVSGSTDAVARGAYRDVNALGVLSIVALRNAVPTPIPFVFGGDGATALVPGSAREQVEAALRGLVELASSTFGLALRAGIVPVAELREAGHSLLVARYAASDSAHYAMFGGTGPGAAEDWVKSPERGARYAVGPGPANADFTGFECRWQPIRSRKGKVLTLLVRARDEPAYASLLKVLAQILDEDEGNPLSVSTLRINTPWRSFRQEVAVEGRGLSLWQRFKLAVWARVRSALGIWAVWTATRMRSFDGATYRQEVVQNSDFRKFDGTLRMVLDVSEAQQQAILRALGQARSRGEVMAFGTQVSDSALMTCAIGATYADHLHFIDGHDGGYTQAARTLKRDLAQAEPSGR